MSSNAMLTAGALAAAAAVLSMPRPGRVRIGDSGPTQRSVPGWRTCVTVAGVAVLTVTMSTGSFSTGWVVVVAIVSLVAVGVRALVIRWRLRTRRAQRRSEVIELCDALVAELQAGLPAQRVISNACRPWPELTPVIATTRLGGDLASAFRQASQRPGAEGLRLVAACWEVSGRSGAGLASVLDRVGTALREEEEAHAEVTAALGSPRATAKLLAGLPLVGLVLGSVMGVDPISFLLTTPTGNGCLVAGVSLALLGVWWVERLAAAVEA